MKIVLTNHDLDYYAGTETFIYAQHRYESLLAAARFPDMPMIFAGHGVLPWPEQPMADMLGIRHYVAVSEEVCDQDEAPPRPGVGPARATIRCGV